MNDVDPCVVTDQAAELLPGRTERNFDLELGSHRLHYRKGSQVLVVSFDNAARPRSMPYEGRAAWGEELYTGAGYSFLGIVARKPDWYRSRELIETLDRMRLDGFFQAFEKVVFIGASMGGFAATAFAPLAPGCLVIALSPQTTLDPAIFPFGGHSPEGPRQDWALPYSDGAKGIQSARKTYVIYDNLDPLDLRHARIFGQVQNCLCLSIPGGGHGPAPTFSEMGILKKLMLSLIEERFSPQAYYEQIRSRRKSANYFRTMQKYVEKKPTAWRTSVLDSAGLRAREAANETVTAMKIKDKNKLSTMLKPLSIARKLISSRNPKGFIETEMQHRLSKTYPQLKRNIFIVTYGRSGSTLLQSLLHTIPECEIRGENHNMMETIWSSAVRARMTRNTWGKTECPPNHPWHGADKIRPGLFAEGMIDSFIANVLQPSPTARYFGFKEIRYDAFGKRFPEVLEFMRRHFKDPLFIFNIRNVEDVAKSAWWKNWKTEDVHKLVNSMDKRFSEYHEQHPDCTFLVSYEEFSQDPLALRPLFEKLGEPLDETKISSVLATKLTH